MKLFILMCCISINVYACDICGCSSSLNFNSITPGYNNSIIGTRYSRNIFESTHPGETTLSKDNYNTFELFGRITLFKKFQILGNIPFHLYNSVEENLEINIKEFGDASLLVNRILIDNSDSIRKLKFFSSIGLGTKFPTGKYNLIQNYSFVHPGLQPGTGSFDFIMQTNNSIRYKNWGNQLDISYRYNTENSNKYKFGNQLAINYRLFYWFNFKKNSILPHIGIDAELKNTNQQNNNDVALTGSKMLLANIGSQFFFEHFAINLQFQKPLYQNINEGYTTNTYRFNSQIIYLF